MLDFSFRAANADDMAAAAAWINENAPAVLGITAVYAGSVLTLTTKGNATVTISASNSIGAKLSNDSSLWATSAISGQTVTCYIGTNTMLIIGIGNSRDSYCVISATKNGNTLVGGSSESSSSGTLNTAKLACAETLYTGNVPNGSAPSTWASTTLYNAPVPNAGGSAYDYCENVFFPGVRQGTDTGKKMLGGTEYATFENMIWIR